jgi:hypothetical protein
MTKRIRVLVLPVGGEPFEELIPADDTLAGLQRLVDGNIELVRLDDGVDLWVNEEFLMNGMLPNRLVGRTVMHGPMVLTRHNDEGETTSILDRDVERYWDLFPVVVVMAVLE